MEADDTARWGEVIPEPTLVEPLPGGEPFTALTWHMLAWLSRNGLRPTLERGPRHTQTVHFGMGSGWLWGELTIGTTNGEVGHLHARWVDRDGRVRLSTVYGATSIWKELERHEAERVERVTWLAGRNGLIVTNPNK